MQTDTLIGALDELRILVLEDEFFIAVAIKDYLKNAGAKSVETAKTIALAREELDAPIDAAIMDVRVPDGASYDLAKELLAQGVGVVFHSGHEEEEDMRKFPQAVFCAKPSTPEELVQGVLDAIQKVSTR